MRRCSGAPIAAVLLAACATSGTGPQPEPAVPGETEPGTPPPSSAGPEADFQAAVTRFSRGDPRGAHAVLDPLLARLGDHPLRASAAALLARLALGDGDAAGARSLLHVNAAGSRAPAVAFVRGLAESRLGNGPQAVALLRPFSEVGPPSIGGALDGDAEPLLRAALAEALALTGDTQGALEQWDRYARLSSSRDAERAYARARAEEMAVRLPNDSAVTAYRASSAALARAVLAPRAAAALRARGDAAGAHRIDDEATGARRGLGFEAAPPLLGPGDPTRLGLAVPLSGAYQAIGQVALRGAMLAIGEPSATAPSGFQVLVRDTVAAGDRPDRSAAELVRREAVIGMVGRGDRRAIDQAARDGIPYVTLDGDPPGRHVTAVQIVHGVDARASELARRALALGARSFAVLGPDSPVGLRLADAFKRAVAAGGARVVAQTTYAASATAFTAAVAQLRKTGFEALFVPDDARRLELIAPALAVADIWPSPWSVVASSRRAIGPRREILLLSTATALTPGLIQRAGNYVQGALLTPGFFASLDDPRGAGFVSRFRQLFNQDPTASDAYSYDGMRLLRTAIERGGRTRADLLRLLSSDPFEGATGTIRFSAERNRADPPLVYVVDGSDIRPLL